MLTNSPMRKRLPNLLHIHHTHNYDLCVFFVRKCAPKRKKGEKGKTYGGEGGVLLVWRRVLVGTTSIIVGLLPTLGRLWRAAWCSMNASRLLRKWRSLKDRSKNLDSTSRGHSGLGNCNCSHFAAPQFAEVFTHLEVA